MIDDSYEVYTRYDMVVVGVENKIYRVSPIPQRSISILLGVVRLIEFRCVLSHSLSQTMSLVHRNKIRESGGISTAIIIQK